MSVKVVSPTDPGQPQLPMSLRPPVTPAAAGTHHVRPRRHSPASAPVVDSRQPELPMPLCRSAAELESGGAGLPVSSRSSAVEVGSEQALPMSLRSSVAESEAGVPQAPMPLRPPAAEVESEQALATSLRPSVAEPEADRPRLPPRPPATGTESDQSLLPMAVRPPAPPVAAGLLAQARRGLAEAERETDPAERFIGAYLAALRGAAAVLAARGRPHRGRARPASTWVLLDSVAPELREWSAFFAGNSAARAAAQAGITGKVTVESAAGLVRAATPFLELVRRLVHGLPITGEAHVA
ncbi:SAV_6107 family HEPN domain-containing protein [Amycolatopsis vastitatis]|uniref:SAV-6107-like HEPN domain-containing protein n=1 Tax=Amycolatopsis vastitatis TaxID=1905142 RepID=A0A229SSA7_9PSEU|nr:SAV_6107 family HEPN domain-containing protein [Amycolatopsis vastitatis]OXM61692.1 hypothetical protein CF165_37950 [Amycolatopsis vastitatis]